MASDLKEYLLLLLILVVSVSSLEYLLISYNKFYLIVSITVPDSVQFANNFTLEKLAENVKPALC